MRYSVICVIRIGGRGRGGGGGAIDQKVVAVGYPRHYNQNMNMLG